MAELTAETGTGRRPSVRRMSALVMNTGLIHKKHLEADRDERKTVLVFGATGMVGGALARALLSYPWFNVKIGTRRPWCSDATLLSKAGCKVVEVDFNYKYSLVQAMKGARFVFLHTHYWETYSSVLEVMHGKTVVDAAIEAGVHHLFYDGTNYIMPTEGRVCNFLRSRLEIQDYIAKSGIRYTIVVLPFYFENLLTVFRPYEVSPDLFAIPIPMEGCSFPCGCLADMALCICKMILNSTSYEGEEVELVSELLTVAQMANGLRLTQQDRHFFDPEITIDDFMEFEFPGAKDFASFFEHYQLMKESPDLTLTRSLNPGVRKLVTWLTDNTTQITALLADTGHHTGRSTKFIMPFRLRKTSQYYSDTSSEEELEKDEEKKKQSRRWIGRETGSPSLPHWHIFDHDKEEVVLDLPVNDRTGKRLSSMTRGSSEDDYLQGFNEERRFKRRSPLASATALKD